MCGFRERWEVTRVWRFADYALDGRELCCVVGWSLG